MTNSMTLSLIQVDGQNSEFVRNTIWRILLKQTGHSEDYTPQERQLKTRIIQVKLSQMTRLVVSNKILFLTSENNLFLYMVEIS